MSVPDGDRAEGSAVTWASSNGIARAKPYFADLRRMIDTVASHPSVIQYELFNENDMVSDVTQWRFLRLFVALFVSLTLEASLLQFNVSNVVRFARLYDHTRLIDADSGGEGLAAQGAFRVGDANDFHAGVWPPTGPTAGATATQFAMVAEYAGISFVTPGHAR